MGLLDEAIREHLELKRRRGADPGDIARAEHEALEPIFPEEPSAPVEEAPLADIHADPPSLEGRTDREAYPEQPPNAASAEAPDFANVGQETAELDMQAVLDADLEHSAQAGTGRPVRAPSAQVSQQDSMEWEVPGSSEPGAVSEEVPGQERLSFE
jgi:hypothetical protein